MRKDIVDTINFELEKIIDEKFDLIEEGIDILLEKIKEMRKDVDYLIEDTVEDVNIENIELIRKSFLEYISELEDSIFDIQQMIINQ